MWQQTFLVLVLFILEVLMYWNSDLYGCYTHDCHTRCLLRLLREIRDISCLGKIKVNNVHSFSDDVWVWVRFAKFCMMTFDYTELPVFWWLTHFVCHWRIFKRWNFVKAQWQFCHMACGDNIFLHWTMEQQFTSIQNMSTFKPIKERGM